MREKISDFENDVKAMDETFALLALHLCENRTNAAKSYFKKLYESVDFYATPKKFDAPDINTADRPVSNTISRDKKMKTVNFFINMPIELHIVDTLWTLFLGKISCNENLITSVVYGNTVLESVVSDFNNKDDGINFQNNRLFNIYFYQYSNWRNNAFKILEENYDKGKDSVLLSLDLQGYFYSIKFSFGKLKEQCNDNSLFEGIQPVLLIMEKVFGRYKEVISPYRKDMVSHTAKQFPLPIGLFSSMVLANIYLSDFDNKVKRSEKISYYGRYVDDLLFVYEKSIGTKDRNEDIILKTLVSDGLLTASETDYAISGLPNLTIQKSKVKIIYLDHTESRALIDIYNRTIRVVPSQIDPIPDYDLKISSFDENAYSIEHFSKENKLRDMGNVSIDAYNVSRFFSTLVQKYSHINSFDNKTNDIQKNITENILQIENFFTGSQCIEYYSNWMNYMYFLVITQRNRELKEFFLKAKRYINNLKYHSLDQNTFRKPSSINKKAQEFLLRHLEICRASALSLDIDMVNQHFRSQRAAVMKYINSNMFNQALIAFPLSNYLIYDKDVSYLKMDIKDIGAYSKIEDNNKFKWSPRFIHYDELLLLLFYYNHKKSQTNTKTIKANYFQDTVVQKYIVVNHLNYGDNLPFEIETAQEIRFPTAQNCEYILRKICVPLTAQFYPKKINIAVANIKLELDAVKPSNRWKNITLKYKSVLNDILRETYKHCDEQVKILVLPELSLPIYWIGDVIRFAKRTQTAVVSGLQYLSDDNGRVYNYIVTVLPFESGKRKYKNAFVYIREKNDYSPIEKVELAKNSQYCVDSPIADYPIFSWKGIDLSAIVCYELTDIMARALLKGKCDIITVPVLNRDTTYFSNIIDSTVRDLHAFIVQANTSIYGDSRVTGPYDRDSKDIFKIKGGDNDNIIVGTIDYLKFINYQANYYDDLRHSIDTMKPSCKKAPKNNAINKKCSKPDIKPLSARYTNHRTKRDKV